MQSNEATSWLCFHMPLHSSPSRVCCLECIWTQFPAPDHRAGGGVVGQLSADAGKTRWVEGVTSQALWDEWCHWDQTGPAQACFFMSVSLCLFHLEYLTPPYPTCYLFLSDIPPFAKNHQFQQLTVILKSRHTLVGCLGQDVNQLKT